MGEVFLEAMRVWESYVGGNESGGRVLLEAMRVWTSSVEDGLCFIPNIWESRPVL